MVFQECIAFFLLQEKKWVFPRMHSVFPLNNVKFLLETMSYSHYGKPPNIIRNYPRSRTILRQHDTGHNQLYRSFPVVSKYEMVVGGVLFLKRHGGLYLALDGASKSKRQEQIRSQLFITTLPHCLKQIRKGNCPYKTPCGFNPSS